MPLYLLSPTQSQEAHGRLSLTSVGHHSINISTVNQDPYLVLLEELEIEWNDRGQQI